MNKVPAVISNVLSDAAKNKKPEDVALLLGIGFFALACKAMEYGYTFNFSYTKEEGFNVSLNPPDKSVS